jgi:hypothetical protein
MADDCVRPEWKVESVRLANHPARGVDSYVELGDILAVTSANLADLRKCAKPNDPVLLYLDGMPLKGMLEFPPSNPAGREALYTLRIGSENRTVWNKLLGSPDTGTTKPVAVSLGLADGFPIPSDTKISLRSVPPFWFAVWFVLFAGGLIAFFWLAGTSNMIRGGTPIGGQAFSIGRSRAAWWFFLVLAAYLLIGLTTGDYTTSLNKTSLILLGIASATYLGSAAVDASKDTPAELAAQDKERARLEGLAAAGTINPAQRDKLTKLKGESQGWLKDVLSDSEGIDFHRFQMLAWTIVLGIFFVTRVWQDLAMPEFDATLLGLMGLSAGTYVGLKIPETTK